jgi:ABC-type nitrate/sulfonate/bicarbonate transport system substrate-binding protein
MESLAHPRRHDVKLSSLQKVSIIAFPGGFNLPLWTASACGFLAARGVDVELHFTTSSMEQLTALISGGYDIGLTAFDNIVAYQEGQGEAAIEREPDLFAFMGGDSGFLRLVVQPAIRSYADLKGEMLSVDALTTGFAFVLRKMLALNGISESDVRFERAGGALQRFEALKAGKHAGTLLVTPFELIGKASGLHVLQDACAVIPHYQGISGAARRAWARENRDALTAFISGYLDALNWLYAPENRAAACALLAERVPNMGPPLAAATCDVLLAEKGGFDRQARLDEQGMRTVLALRSEYGRPNKVLTDPHAYCDPTYYERALR